MRLLASKKIETRSALLIDSIMKSGHDKIRLYFLGSGKIAVPILEAVASSDLIELVGVGTQEDQPSGRKKKLQSTPVGVWCEKNGFNVDKPHSVNKTVFLSKLESLSCDFILVVSFGQLLKKRILSLPKYSCINVHASLLPKYRGASPIVAPILNGDSSTGVAVMAMEKGLDTGPVFAVFEHNLSGMENAEELELTLGKLTAKHIVEVLLGVYSKKILPIPQDHSKVTYAGKIIKKDGELDWNFTAEKIERMTRAYYRWPGVYFYLHLGDNRRKKIQITEAVVCRNENNNEPGQIIKADNKSWVIACGTEALEIRKLIPEGKKEMVGSDFIRGCRIAEGNCV